VFFDKPLTFVGWDPVNKPGHALGAFLRTQQLRRDRAELDVPFLDGLPS